MGGCDLHMMCGETGFTHETHYGGKGQKNKHNMSSGRRMGKSNIFALFGNGGFNYFVLILAIDSLKPGKHLCCFRFQLLLFKNSAKLADLRACRSASFEYS